jgi:predicted nucleic acid-binding Zn ribbon protein
MTRRRAPRQAGEAFRVARDLAAPKTALASVQANWSGAVGAQIAEVAQPISERSGTLIVECTNAMWAQELDLMQTQLLERLREALGEGAPEAIKFRVARGS